MFKELIKVFILQQSWSHWLSVRIWSRLEELVEWHEEDLCWKDAERQYKVNSAVYSSPFTKCIYVRVIPTLVVQRSWYFPKYILTLKRATE
jgi:hypothetical protein